MADEIQKESFLRINDILMAMLPPVHERVDFVDFSLFGGHPFVTSKMPFWIDESVDFDTRFSAPMEKCAFDRRFNDIFRLSDEDWDWPGERVSTYFQADHWARWFSGLLNYHRPDPRYNRAIYTVGDSMLDLSSWQRAGFNNTKASKYLNEDNENTTWQYFGIYGASEHHSPPLEVDCTHEYPHLSIILAHDVVMDERIARSEVICISSLMKQRIRYAAWKKHGVFLVFLYHFSSTHLRITQSHFDGYDLHLRRTDPVPLPSNPDMVFLKMLMRWFFAKPIGDTLWAKASLLAEDEDEFPSHFPPSSSQKMRVES